MAGNAVIILRKRTFRNERAVCSPCQTWFVVRRAVFRTWTRPRRVEAMPTVKSKHHQERRGHHCKPGAPTNASTSQSMQHEAPYHHERRCHVHPVGHRARTWLSKFCHHPRNVHPCQQHFGDKRDNGCDKRDIPHPNCTPVRVVMRPLPVPGAKGDRRQCDGQTKH